MLIVVAIIGILSGAILVGLGPVQRSGRDARRISDLRQVQNGLEIYFNKCGYYPGNAAPNDCGVFSKIGNWNELTNALTGSNIGINHVPNDPTGGKDYFYGTNEDGNSYILGATLEDENNAALRQDVDGSVYDVDCADPVYCIQL